MPRSRAVEGGTPGGARRDTSSAGSPLREPSSRRDGHAAPPVLKDRVCRQFVRRIWRTTPPPIHPSTTPGHYQTCHIDHIHWPCSVSRGGPILLPVKVRLFLGDKTLVILFRWALPRIMLTLHFSTRRLLPFRLRRQSVTLRLPIHTVAC